jgi:hypothetical protein
MNIIKNLSFTYVAIFLLLAMGCQMLVSLSGELLSDKLDMKVEMLTVVCTAIPFITIIRWFKWSLNSLAGIGLLAILSVRAIVLGSSVAIGTTYLDVMARDGAELVECASNWAYFFSSSIWLVVILCILSTIGSLLIASHLWLKANGNSLFKILAAGFLVGAIFYAIELIIAINIDSINDFSSSTIKTLDLFEGILSYTLLLGLAVVGAKEFKKTATPAPGIRKPFIGISLGAIIATIGGFAFMKLFAAPWFVQFFILAVALATILVIAHILYHKNDGKW